MARLMFKMTRLNLRADEVRFLCQYKGRAITCCSTMAILNEGAIVPIRINGASYGLKHEWNTFRRMRLPYLTAPTGRFAGFLGPELGTQTFEVDQKTLEKFFSAILYEHKPSGEIWQSQCNFDKLDMGLRNGYSFDRDIPAEMVPA